MRTTSTHASRGMIVAGLVLTLNLFGYTASAGPSDELVGTWVAHGIAQNRRQALCVLQFTKAGQLSVVLRRGGNAPASSMKAAYQADKRAIHGRDAKGRRFSWVYRLRGNHLTIRMGRTTLTCVRRGSVRHASGERIPQRCDRNVIVNRVRLSGRQLAVWQYLERKNRVRMPDCRYWYDPRSGLMGFEGGPSRYKIPAGLPLGGRLRPDAAGGRGNVYVNGLALHSRDLARLQRMFGFVRPGRYWLLADGSYGRAGCRTAMGNLFRRNGGGQRESVVSGYFLTGISVISG